MTELIISDKVIENIKGKVIAKPANDQNTDDIIPARYLSEITFENMGNYVYANERIKEGVKVESHVFNKPEASEAKILVTGANYGCGSSREHAPQALHRFGIDLIIAESFAEIFAGNCASLGLVCVTVSSDIIRQLVDYVQENTKVEINVNLDYKTINYGNETTSFEMPEARRQSFLKGTWDAMALLQQNTEGITKMENDLEYLGFE